MLLGETGFDALRNTAAGLDPLLHDLRTLTAKASRKRRICSMTSRTSPQDATTAAARILGCYPEIPASDKQVFISGLVEMLLLYPFEVVQLASSPAQGIPSKLKFLSLADIRGLLDSWGAEHAERLKRIASARQPAERISFDRPEPQPGDLANVFVPEGHSRYAKLAEWTKTGHVRKWRFGHASDGRNGLWVSWDIWDGGMTSPAPTLSKAATPTMDQLRKIYAKPETFGDAIAAVGGRVE
jgi:hypothetical protein